MKAAMKQDNDILKKSAPVRKTPDVLPRANGRQFSETPFVNPNSLIGRVMPNPGDFGKEPTHLMPNNHIQNHI